MSWRFLYKLVFQDKFFIITEMEIARAGMPEAVPASLVSIAKLYIYLDNLQQKAIKRYRKSVYCSLVDTN